MAAWRRPRRSKTIKSARPARSHRRLSFETLEDRRVLSLPGLAPELPGMVLVDPDVENLRGQMIYLNYQGEENVTYRGPVEIGPFDVPPFEAPGELAGQEDEIMATVTEQLNELFAPVEVTFTLDPPPTDAIFSTVFVGGTSMVLGTERSFLGMAESVDVGNVDRSDKAFVFPAHFSVPSVEDYTTVLGDLVAHESAHLLGWAHEGESAGDSGFDVLDDFAASFWKRHPQDDNSISYVTVGKGTHTFGVDFDPNGWRQVQWYTTYSGDDPIAPAEHVYFNSRKNFTFNAGGTYWIRAELWGSNVLGNWGPWKASHRWLVTVDAQGPDAPTGLAMLRSDDTGNSDTDRVTSNRRPRFTWNIPSDPEGSAVAEYDWQIWTSNNSYVTGNTTSSREARPSSNLPDGLYKIRVKAKDEFSNWGDWSSELSFFIDGTAPTSFSLTSPGANAIVTTPQPEFRWESSYDVSGIWHYQLQLEERTDATSWSRVLNRNRTTTSYTLASSQTLKSGTEYRWRVFAVDEAGNSRLSTSGWRYFSTAHADLTRSSSFINRTTVYPGDTISGTVIVKNEGNFPANAGYVHYYWKEASRDYSNSYKVDTSSYGRLLPGATQERNFEYKVPWDATPGTYYFYYWIDATDTTKESNENNNKLFWTITVKPVAEITSWNVPTVNVRSGQTYEASVAVKNTWTDARKFWVGLSFANTYTDMECWPDGWFDVPPLQTNTIQPGHTEVVTFSMEIDTWLPPLSDRYEAHFAVWDGFDETKRPEEGQMVGVGPHNERFARAGAIPAFRVTATDVSDPFGLQAFDSLNLLSAIPSSNRVNLTDLTRTAAQSLRDIGGTLLDTTTRNLVVLMHGWQQLNPFGSNPYGSEPWERLIDGLKLDTTLDNDWSFYAHDWRNDASPLTNWALAGRGVALAMKPKVGLVAAHHAIAVSAGIAAQRAYQHGLMLGQKIGEQIGFDNLSQVQIIGHSAGSWGVLGLVQMLSSRLASSNALQTIYLDPFIPDNLWSVSSWLRNLFPIYDFSPFNASALSKAADYSRMGVEEFAKAQAYYSKSLYDPNYLIDFTQAWGPAAIINWTWTTEEGKIVETSDIRAKYAGHSGPIQYYADSIHNPDGTDFTGKGWNIAVANMPQVTVVTPGGGETWQRGTTREISWDSRGTIGANVKIDLYRGTGFDRTITSSTLNNGTYEWSIPEDLPLRTDFRIRITSVSNASIWDQSDGPFGIIAAPAPADIYVRLGATTIESNSTTPVWFGTHDEETAAPERTFTIYNSGDEAVTVGTVYLDNNNGFSVTQQPASSVPGRGGSTTFTLRMNTALPGDRSADVRFANSDASKTPFRFKVAGSVVEIAIEARPKLVITDDSSDPADRIVTLPNTLVGGASDPRTVTISNIGDETLNITDFAKGGTNPADFKAVVRNDRGGLVAGTNFTIAAGKSFTVEMVFKPTAPAGSKSATITFNTNDPDQETAILTMSGTAVTDERTLTNVALASRGGTATADSTGSYGGTRYPHLAIDGDYDTGWANSWAMPAWLQVEFDREYEIEEVGVRWGPHQHTFSVSLSRDGENWTEVVESRVAVQEPHSYELFEIHPTQARFIRMDITTTTVPDTHIFKAIVHELEAYATVLPDASRAAWSTYLGGSEMDVWLRDIWGGFPHDGVGVAVDSDGNAFVAGTTYSEDFAEATNDPQGGTTDAYLAKVSPEGDTLWVKYLGGSDWDGAMSVAVDAQGNAVIVGSTSSDDFTGAANDYHDGGWTDGFVAKVSSEGQLVWATYLGGSETDEALDVAIDGQGNILVTGWTNSDDFNGAINDPYGVGKESLFSSWGDGFVAKLSSDGGLLWTTYVGGSGDEGGLAIAVDAAGNAYITGGTESDVLPHATNDFTGGFYDGFLAKVSPEGQILWTSYFGGSSEDAGFGIAVDDSGDVLVTGGTLSTDLAGANNQYQGGTADGFVAKFSPSGTLLWSTYIGGSGEESGFDIAIDSAGNAWVTGGTNSTDFDQTENHYRGGEHDAFVAVIDPDGSLLWSTYLGGSDEEGAFGIALDSLGSALIAGFTYSSDFEGANNTYRGAGDAFLTRIASVSDNEPPLISGLTTEPDPVLRGSSLTITAEGVSDPDGEVALVEFYHNDHLLGVDADGTDGWTWTVSTGGWALGEHEFTARAQDDDGAWSEWAEATVTVGLDVSQLSIEGLETDFRDVERLAAIGGAQVHLRNTSVQYDFDGPIHVQIVARPVGAADASSDVSVGQLIDLPMQLNAGSPGSVVVPVVLPSVSGDYRLIASVGSDHDPGASIGLQSETSIQVRANLMDLEIAADRSGLPLTVTAGDRVLLNATIRNLDGRAVRGRGTLQFLAQPTGSDAPPVLLAESSVSLRLRPFATSGQRVRMVIPSTIPGDTYDLIVRFQAGEGLEGLLPGRHEDHVAGAVTVLAPDLVASSISLTRTPVVYSLESPALGGTSAQAVVEFENAGPGSALGTVDIRLYAVPEAGGQPHQIGQVIGQRVRLRPGATQRANVSVVLPTLEGVYQLKAVVDPGSSLVETDDSNNSAWTAPFAIREPFVELVVALDSVQLPEWQVGDSHGTAAGTAGRMNLTVSNAGNIPVRGTTDILIYATTEVPATGTEILIGQLDNRRVSLAPDGSSRYRVSFSLPNDLPPDDYFFFAQLHPEAQIVELYAEDGPFSSGQAFTDRVYRVRRPNLVAQDLTVSFGARAHSGESGTATVAFMNAGEVPASGSARVMVFAVPEDDPETSIPLGDATPRRLNLAPGAATTLRVLLNLPPWLHGVYTLRAVVDVDDEIDETDIPAHDSDPRTGDNSVDAPDSLTVEERFVDLAVHLSPETLPENILAAGDRVMLNVNLENLGNVAALGATRVDVYGTVTLEPEQPPTAQDVQNAWLLGTTTARVRLGAGAQTTARVRGVVPAELVQAPAGENTTPVYVFAVIHPQPFRDGFVDQNSANNISQVTEEVPTVTLGVPDLAITKVEPGFRNLELTGASGNVSVEITNVGPVTAAGTATVFVDLISGEGGQPVETFATSVRRLSLRTQARPTSVRVPVTLPDEPGEYQVQARIVFQSHDGVEETVLNNNTNQAEATIQVEEPFTDVAVQLEESSLPTETLTTGSRFLVTVQVENFGNIQARDRSQLEIHAVRSADVEGQQGLLAQDQLTEQTRIGASRLNLRLAPQASRTLRVRCRLPEFDPDQYRLVVQLIPSDTLEDVAPENHVAFSQGTILISGA